MQSLKRISDQGQVGGRAILLTLTGDNSSPTIRVKYVGKWQSCLQTKLVQLHVHGKHIYCWSDN